MEPVDYLHLQMRLEGIEPGYGRLLRQVEVVPGEKMPLLLIAQLTDGAQVVYYDELITPDLHRDLSVHIPEIRFPQIDPILQRLKSQDIEFEVGHYKTYVFPSRPANEAGVTCLSRNEPSIRAFGFDVFSENVFVVRKNEVVVSACVSARENAKCGEAWVYTAPDHRHQGLAQKVVRAWARSLIDAGKIPFYSHKIENMASARLAAKLGLQPVFEEIAITRIE